MVSCVKQAIFPWDSLGSPFHPPRSCGGLKKLGLKRLRPYFRRQVLTGLPECPRSREGFASAKKVRVETGTLASFHADPAFMWDESLGWIMTTGVPGVTAKNAPGR